MSSRTVLTHPRFWPLFWTQFAGAFNDNLMKNALGILVVYSGITAFGLPPEQFVPLSAAVFIAPFFLFSATAGQLADRLDKSRLVRITKAVEVGIMLLAAVGFLTAQVPLLLLLLFAMGTQSAFFGPVKYGIIPQLLDEEDLVGGNALIELATYLAILGGTIAGGVLVGITVGDLPVGRWLVAAGLIAIAIAGYVLGNQVPPCDAEQPDLKIQWDPVRPTWDILKRTHANPVVWQSILGITWFWSFGTAFLSLFPTYAKDVLGGGEGVATLFLALFSMGIAAGSMLTEKLSRHRLELGVVPIGAAGMSVFCGVLFLIGQPWTPDPQQLMGLGAFLSRPGGWAITLTLLTISGFGGLYIVPLYTLIQQRSAPEERGRIVAGNNIINALCMVGMSLALMALQRMGLTPPQIFGLLAVLNAIAAVYIFTKVPEFMIRFVVWMVSVVMYRIDVKGLEHLPKEGGCVVVANHVSYIDWIILGGAIPRPVHFVMDVSFAHLPVVRMFANQEFVIPIASPKRDEVAYEQAFVSIRKKLRQGWTVGIFPEGHLTEDGDMARFRKGIEKILDRDPVPVVPIHLDGLWGSWFSRKDGPAMQKRPRRFWSPVQITIGAPIPADKVTAESLQRAVAELAPKAV